jgi:hypothetical protein
MRCFALPTVFVHLLRSCHKLANLDFTELHGELETPQYDTVAIHQYFSPQVA